MLLYIERWLKAPMQLEDEGIVARTAGTPQGGVISPLLANLFLHYAFDMWMARNYSHIPFERYADDAICHCESAEAAQVRLEVEVSKHWTVTASTIATPLSRHQFSKSTSSERGVGSQTPRSITFLPSKTR